MTDQSIAVAEAQEEKDLEENQEDTEIVSIRAGRLLKLKHSIRKLKGEALNGFSEELEDVKSACNNTNALLGELNDTTGGKQAG